MAGNKNKVSRLSKQNSHGVQMSKDIHICPLRCMHICNNVIENSKSHILDIS